MKQNNLSLNVLQAQVYDLSAAVQAHWTKDEVLAEFGIKIIGRLDNADLPPISTNAPPPGGTEAYGEAYAVGTEEPYSIYIWTRPDAYHPDAYWFDIGPIAIEGPQGISGVSITNATLNADNQLVFTFSDGRVITIPRSLKGDPGGSPSITLTTNNEGVIIKVLNPDGTLKQSALVRNGEEGESIVGPPGPPGYFNILGALQTQEELNAIPASSVAPGSAYLVWHAVAAEENGGHYDLWINIFSNGVQAWQGTGRVAAGTYIFENEQPINTFNADTKLNKITDTGAYKLYGVNASGNEWNPTLRNIPQTTSTTYKYQPVMYDITDGKSVNNGLIRIAETPLEDYHTASKGYVDNRYRLYRHDINFIANSSGDSYTCYFTIYNTQQAAMNNSSLHTDNIISINGVVDKADGNQYPIAYGSVNPGTSYVLLYYYDHETKQMVSANLDAAEFTTYDHVTRIF